MSLLQALALTWLLFSPCNQLTETSYIYQSLGDVEWYVRWSSRHDNHDARGDSLLPPGPPHPLLWETPMVWATVGHWDRGWQVGRRSLAPGAPWGLLWFILKLWVSVCESVDHFGNVVFFPPLTAPHHAFCLCLKSTAPSNNCYPDQHHT